MTRLLIAFAAVAMLAGIARAVEISPAFPNLAAFDSPINIEDPLDGTDRLFVVERAGQIYVFQNDPGVSQRSLFLDISSLLTTQGECGLLGLAFHPDYETNRFFYVCYVDASPFQTVIARFTANAANPNFADLGSQVPALTISQNGFFHKGGCIEFGPDGYLYISLGEDGTPNNAQSLTTLKGKVLRIDVDSPGGGLQYGIPPDNPFEGNPNGYREEIYAFGFRNPWRFSCDSQTGQLWLGDVGQNTWEEVDVILKGRNYGWPRMEGRVCYPIGQPCDTTNLDLVLPVAVYNHGGNGASITGGCIYRGPSVPSLYGEYVFADYIDGRIWHLDPEVNPSSIQLIDDTALNIAAFGTDASGELYFTTFNGAIYRFVESTTDVPAPAPAMGALHAVHPNPFQSSAIMEYSIASAGRTMLEVFDVRGQIG
ncbi:MAG TPA: PQQ-dependent sugar dehydrogenase, partial [Candidatus Krumholzibacteria bacterium]|nr:PQQ-dependent sugar dehydrogenase [Candidatus Krumholzibacteria bacterium]